MTTLPATPMQCLYPHSTDLGGFLGDQYPRKSLEGYGMVNGSVFKPQLLVDAEREHEAKLQVYQVDHPDHKLLTGIACQFDINQRANAYTVLVSTSVKPSRMLENGEL